MPAKKAASKKATAKKTAAKKAAAKKTAAKKAAVKKTAARKTAPKKAAAPASPLTTITAKVDVGFGNALYIRGEGGGLDWDEGQLMECIDSDEWSWTSSSANTGIVFKFLINDQLWSLGEDLTVPAGGVSISEPRF